MSNSYDPNPFSGYANESSSTAGDYTGSGGGAPAASSASGAPATTGTPAATGGTGILATLNALPTTAKVVGAVLLAGLVGFGVYSSMLGDAPKKGGR